MSRLLVALAAAGALLVTGAVPAGAKPPQDGDWTLINKDGFQHYACKLTGKGQTWRIRTASRGKKDDVGIYGGVARGSDRRVPIERRSNDWESGYIRLLLRGVRSSDRLWMQAAGYGPIEAWTTGFPVRKITRCFSPA